MTHVEVKPDVLRWAVTRSAPKDILSRFSELDKWLTGKTKPTLRQLEKLANATAIPLGYFFLDEPPQEDLPVPLLRTQGVKGIRQPSPDLIEVAYTMQRRQAWMHEYLQELGHERLPFVGSFPVEAHPVEVSQSIRNALKLGDNWATQESTWKAALRTLQKKAEDAGIVVASSSVVGNNPHRPLDPSEFRGFVLVDEYAPLVFINGADAKAAQMFTLAHELAHVWLGKSAAFDLHNLQPAEDRVERVCNQIAAEFLVPGERLRQRWKEASGQNQPFQVLARQFKVSEPVVAKRALDLRLIGEDRFLEFYDDYSRRTQSARSREGGDFYATQCLRLGRRFAAAVVQAVREGDLLYHEAYRLTGLYGRTFERFVKHLTEDMP